MQIGFEETEFKEVELREHNQETYKDLKNQISLYGRTCVVQPVGTGKSYLLMKLLQDYYDSFKVVVNPSAMMLDNFKNKPEWVENKTLTCTYNGLKKLVEQIKTYNLKGIKLIMLDELHRAGATNWGKYVNELMELLPNAIVVGFTATPIRFLDKKRDMVQELFKGISCGNLSIQQCIDRGILPHINYVLGLVEVQKSLAKLRLKVSKSDKAQELKDETLENIDNYSENWNRDEYIINILKEHIGNCVEKNYKHIVFMPSISMANEMTETVRDWFETVYKDKCAVNIYNINSSNKDSDSKMLEFSREKAAGEIDVLINVNMATESFHIDNMKSVVMLRYTNSPNLYMQQLGRALACGGEDVYAFDFIGNVSAIDTVTDFLNGLESRVSNVLKGEVYERAKQNANKLFKRFDDNTDELRGLMKQVDKLMLGKWDTYMENLEELVAQGNISDLSEIEDKELKKWAVTNQRALINKTLVGDKRLRFIKLGTFVYRTNTLKAYDPTDSLLRAVNSVYNGNKENDGLVERLKYRLYIGRIPVEIIRFIEDTNLDVDISDTWLSKYEEHRVSTDIINITLKELKTLVDYIINNEKLMLYSPSLDITEYMNTATYIIELEKMFKQYDGKEDTYDSVVVNIMNKYWSKYKSKMQSVIELDPGVLKNNLLVLKDYCGNLADRSEVFERVYKVDRGIRAISTNMLLDRLGYKGDN